MKQASESNIQGHKGLKMMTAPKGGAVKTTPKPKKVKKPKKMKKGY